MSKNRGQILPAHVRRSRSAPENQPPIKGRHLAAAAGGIALIAAATAYGLFGGEGSPEGRSAETKPSPSATASATSEKAYSPTPIPSVTASAETQTPEPSPGLDDPFKPDRLIAAKPYDGCKLSFTSDGRQGDGIRLNLDLVLERDPTSQRMRKKEQTRQLSWTDPKVIAIPLGKKDKPLRFGRVDAPLEGANTTIVMPNHTNKTYVLGITAIAASHYGSTEYVTQVVTPCTTTEQDSQGIWREAPAPTILEDIVEETQVPHAASTALD